MNEGPPALPEPAPSYSWLRHVLAWAVHLYTALGLVLAASIAVLLVRGGAASFAWAFAFMFVAVVIDATDGILARAVQVKKVLPKFDGTLLDNLVDFLNYTFLPLVLLWRAGVIPEGMAWALLVPLLASAYGFCQVDAKTADGHFQGFPSHWNIVAFYLYLFGLPLWANLALLWILALLTFVPSLYLYPTRHSGLIEILTNVLGGIWAIQLCWLLSEMIAGAESAEPWALNRGLVLSTLPFPVFYMAASWVITLRRWTAQGIHVPAERS